jgi:hypothetical protein
MKFPRDLQVLRCRQKFPVRGKGPAQSIFFPEGMLPVPGLPEGSLRHNISIIVVHYHSSLAVIRINEKHDREYG